MDRGIAAFYNGQSIFITGGTGFLGKVLLEKLLYSFSGINKIYLLMRQKCDADIHQSLQDMLKKPVFSRLRNENPQALNKIIPIIGDISEPKLGINEEDEQTLIENVSIVFHVAATVRFNEPLKIAFNINVLGTLRVLDLCHRMRNKKAFVHVSTAYCNANRKFVEEVIYPAPASIQEVENFIRAGITEDEVQQIIKERINTYLFTKAIAESMVSQNHGTIPTIIVRPSVITSSKVEPIVGWIDSWLGAAALATAIAKGLNRVLLGHPNNYLDLIPVDYVSNLIVVAAAKGTRSEDVTVYGSSTSGINPITLKGFLDMCIAETVKHKCNDLPMPFCCYTRSKWLVTIMTFAMQIIPAYIADTLLWIMGKRKRYLKIQTKMSTIRNTLENFTNNSWVFSATKTRALAKSLSPSEIEQFSFDPADIDWKIYIPSYCDEGRPNTYTFTKALAENVVAENRGNVPTIIVRPSIVSSSKKEPIVGWIDNWFGASALITTIMKGLNRVLLSNPNNTLDLIPVDYVSNLIIVAAAKCECSKEVAVYNSSSSAANPITMQKLADLIISDSNKHKFYDVPMPSIHFTQFKWVVLLMTLLFQTIPAYIADIFLLITGKKARYMKIQNRVSLVRNTLEYFTSHNWLICAPKAVALAESLSTSDKQQFPCNPVDIDWDVYIPTYCQGIRQFLCKT